MWFQVLLNICFKESGISSHLAIKRAPQKGKKRKKNDKKKKQKHKYLTVKILLLKVWSRSTYWLA